MKSFFGIDVRDFIWKRELIFREELEKLGVIANNEKATPSIRKAALDTMEIVARKHKEVED